MSGLVQAVEADILCSRNTRESRAVRLIKDGILFVTAGPYYYLPASD